MATILLTGPDPETREILKLRLEVAGHEVLTALGEEDALPVLNGKRPAVSVVDVVGFDDSEKEEAEAISKAASKMRIPSVVLMPRAKKGPAKPKKICELCGPGSSEELSGADLIVRKPYDLTALVKEIDLLINNPRTSCSSRRGPRRRS